MLKEKRFQFAFRLCYDVISLFPVLNKLDNNLILRILMHSFHDFPSVVRKLDTNLNITTN
jgi:hypothetical protein